MPDFYTALNYTVRYKQGVPVQNSTLFVIPDLYNALTILSFINRASLSNSTLIFIPDLYNALIYTDRYKQGFPVHSTLSVIQDLYNAHNFIFTLLVPLGTVTEQGFPAPQCIFTAIGNFSQGFPVYVDVCILSSVIPCSSY